MLVKDKMTHFPITIGRMESLEGAERLMMEKHIRHLPVVHDGKVIGILSYTDVMRALPSKVTTLERREATYLFSQIKVKDALPEKQRLVTINENACLEEAALLMRSYKIGALPVLDDDGNLVGLCSETDIFDAFIDMMGVRSSGFRIEVVLPDTPGQLAQVTDIIRSFNVNIARIAIYPVEGQRDLQKAMFRIDIDDINPIVESLRAQGYEVDGTADYSKVYSHLKK